MQYMLLIYADEEGWNSIPPEEQGKAMQEWNDYTAWLKDTHWYLAGDALQPTTAATSVRIRDGETLTTDGPFAETKEQLGGYYLLDCTNLDEAIEASVKCPGVHYGTLEVRPVMVFDEEGNPS